METLTFTWVVLWLALLRLLFALLFGSLNLRFGRFALVQINTVLPAGIIQSAAISNQLT